ncbi:MAG: RING finger protein [Chloroflexota bacterium]
MSENEEVIRITAEDIDEANRLSLHCPICASAVERHTRNAEMAPVYCSECETLYHLACWEQNGTRCAVLGCHSETYRRVEDVDLGPVLTIERSEIPREAPRTVVSANGRNKRLKKNEQRMQREMKRRHFWRDLWESLLRAIKIWPSDPS